MLCGNIMDANLGICCHAMRAGKYKSPGSRLEKSMLAEK